MVVDRGGLQYTIEVQDAFSANTARFAADIATAEKAWAKFRRTIQTANTVTSRAASAQNNFASATSRSAKESAAAAAAAKKQAAAYRALNTAAKGAATSTRTQAKAAKSAAASTAATAAGATKQAAAFNALTEARKRLAREQRTTATLEEQERLRQDRSFAAQERARIAIERNIAVRKKLEAVRRAAAASDAVSSNRQIQDLQTQVALTEKIAKLRRQAVVAGTLAGRAPPATSADVATLQAEKRFSEQLLELRTRRQLDRLQKSNAEFRRLNRTLRRTENRANRVAFTFRRLFGILAAFAAARFVISGFTKLVKDSIAFNASLEQAVLSIQSLIAATADVTDPFGEAVDSATALVLANKEATRQVRLLRDEAQKTSATFKDILFAFQTAIAPGFTAGFDLDQIRAFSINISKAATAIGLAQNQLAEEIRSLLQGTITARATRIATALGITPEDIRRAKEAGNLFEFLSDRLSAFEAAGERALGNFNVLLTNTADAIQRVTGEGAAALFDEIKGLLQDIRGLVLEDPEGGLLEPDPAAVNAFKQIADTLKIAVTQARTFIKNLDLDSVGTFFEKLRSILFGVVEIVSAVVRGITTGFSNATKAIGTVVSGISDLVGGGLGIADIVELVVEWATWLGTIKIALSLLISPFKIILSLVTGVVQPIALIGIGLKEIGSTTLPIVVGGFRRLSRLVAIIGVGIGRAGLSLGRWILTLGPIALTLGKIGLVVGAIAALMLLTSRRTSAVQKELEKGEQRIRVIREQAQALRDDFTSLSGSAKAEQAVATQTELIRLKEQELKEEIALKEAREKRLSQLAEESRRLRRLFPLRPDPGATESFDLIVDLDKPRQLREEIARLKKELETLRITASGLDQLGATFGDLQITISASTKGLEEQGNIVSRLKADIREARDELVQFIASFDAVSEAGQILQVQSEARAKFDKEGLQLSIQRAAAEQRVKTAIEAQAAARLRLAGVDAGAVDQLEETVALVRQYLKATSDQVSGTLRLEGLQRDLNRARKEGDEDAVLRLQDLIDKQESGLKTIEGSIKRAQASYRTLLEGVEADNLATFVAAVRSIVAARNQQAAAQQQVNDLTKEEKRLLDLINEATNTRVQQLALESIAKSKDEIRNLEVQLRTEQAINRAVAARDRRGIEAAQIRQQVEFARLQENLLKRRQDATIRALEAAAKQTQDEKTRAAIIAQITAEAQRYNLEIALTRERIAELIRQHDELADTNRKFGDDIAKGAEDFAAAWGDAFENIRQLTADVLGEIAPFFSSLVTDLITGTLENSDQVEERFGQFLSNIANRILETVFNTFLADLLGGAQEKITELAQLSTATEALDKGALALGTAAGTLTTGATTLQKGAGTLGGTALALKTAAGTLDGAALVLDGAALLWREVAAEIAAAAAALAAARGAGGAAGGRRGGKVSRIVAGKRPRPSIAHGKAPGFAAGGSPVRPRGLHPQDTVPIWVTPKEWVIRPESTKLYGDAIMDKLNRGLIDPGILRALAGVGNFARFTKKRRSVPGFRSGGPVDAARITTEVIREIPGGEGGGGVSLAILSPSEENMDRFLRGGGGGALMRFLEEHADELNTITNTEKLTQQ